jgi:hypothetical protein
LIEEGLSALVADEEQAAIVRPAQLGRAHHRRHPAGGLDLIRRDPPRTFLVFQNEHSTLPRCAQDGVVRAHYR